MFDHIAVLCSFTQYVIPDSSPCGVDLMLTGLPDAYTIGIASVGGGFGSWNGHGTSVEDAGEMGCPLLPVVFLVMVGVSFEFSVVKIFGVTVLVYDSVVSCYDVDRFHFTVEPAIVEFLSNLRADA